MKHNRPCTSAPVTTVLATDQQTGLPTLMSFCAELDTLLKQNPILSLIIFCLDGISARTTESDEATQNIILTAAHLAAESLTFHPEARLYRTAHDSFAMVLPGLRRAPAMQIAEALRQRIERHGNGVTATFAVAGAPHDAGEAGALIAVCEVQLICGPQGRNRVHAATPVESLPPSTTRLANMLISRMLALVELGQQLQESEQQALHDPISGLPNTRSFEQTLPRYLDRCIRLRAPLALLLIDGDSLKRYNDHFGYRAGNEWIQRIGQTLASNLRPGDFLARWLVGDEFVVLLPNTARDQALEMAERLRHAVEHTNASDSSGTISIGIGLASGTPLSSEALQDAARNALLTAKHRGRNQVVLVEAASTQHLAVAAH